MTANGLAQKLKGRQGRKGPDQVRAYTRGKPLPPLDFLEIAAEALQVRAAWLAFGEGPMESSLDEVESETLAGGLTIGRTARDAMDRSFPDHARLGTLALDALWEAV